MINSPQIPNIAESPCSGDELYKTVIGAAGLIANPALLDEVKRLHRAALSEALVLRAFNTVRSAQAAQKRKEAL